MDERLLTKDVIVFDVGNVLVRFDPEAISKGYHLNEQLRRGIFESGLWSWIDTGLIHTGELARMMCAAAHTDSEEDFLKVSGLLDGFYQHELPLEASTWVPELKAMGKRLYYLTNYSSPGFERTKERFPFFKHFDGGVVSAHEHIVKPMPRIYELLCERYGFQPEEALFIDDNINNIHAAESLGFSVWHYTGRTE